VGEIASWRTKPTQGAGNVAVGLDVAAHPSSPSIEDAFDMIRVEIPQHFLNIESSSTPSSLPHGGTTSRPFDLIHARDAIQNVKKENGSRMLCNILESKAFMFLTTSYLNETGKGELGGAEGRLFQ
jgi:hypothetical protein